MFRKFLCAGFIVLTGCATVPGGPNGMSGQFGQIGKNGQVFMEMETKSIAECQQVLSKFATSGLTVACSDMSLAPSLPYTLTLTQRLTNESATSRFITLDSCNTLRDYNIKEQSDTFRADECRYSPYDTAANMRFIRGVYNGDIIFEMEFPTSKQCESYVTSNKKVTCDLKSNSSKLTVTGKYLNKDTGDSALIKTVSAEICNGLSRLESKSASITCDK